MKTMYRTILGTSLLLLAGGAAAMPGHDGPPRGQPPEVLAMYDLDQDGRITREEVEQVSTAAFAAGDLDVDGTLSATELGGVMDAHREAMLGYAFSALDANTDGVLSEDEFGADEPFMPAQTLTRVFALVDSDGSSTVDVDEFVAYKSPGSPVREFVRLDADANGSVSEDEFVGAGGLAPRPPRQRPGRHNANL